MSDMLERGAAVSSGARRTASEPAGGARHRLDVRSGCQGVSPLRGRLEAWQVQLCRRRSDVADWVEAYGSPLNIVSPSSFVRNVNSMRHFAAMQGISLDVFFARKANRCLAFVDQCITRGWGVDVASQQELEQTLNRGCLPERIVCTAAVKSRELMQMAVEAGVTIVIDNEDEWRLAVDAAGMLGKGVSAALRLSGFQYEGSTLASRFGTPLENAAATLEAWRSLDPQRRISLRGVHFHLAGYSAEHRAAAIRQTLRWVDEQTAHGHRVEFIDIGGGMPVSYLSDEGEWTAWWDRFRGDLAEKRHAMTYQGHDLGLQVADGQVQGDPNVYPFYQATTAPEWLASVFGARGLLDGTTIASEVQRRGLQIRCEPGRAALDGAGVTLARVEYRKPRGDGSWFIGLAMNHTQCRTSSDDFMVDPLLIPCGTAWDDHDAASHAAIEGYLTGAYCTETELLTLRKLQFPAGVRRGDVIAFPNTAGYFMHFRESRSHQFPLAENRIWDSAQPDQLVPDDVA